MVQRLEPNTQGTTNTLTTVQKDNLVAEPIILDDTYRVREPRQFEGVSPTIRATRNGFKVVEPIVYDDYNGRVREDQDTTFPKNKIVVPVLCAIFRQLIEEETE